MWTLARPDFDGFLGVLAEGGRTVLGPVERDGVVRLGPVRSAADLPVGRTDRQEPARYRLIDREDGALFSYAVGPDSWKRFLFAPESRQWTATRDARGEPRFVPEPAGERTYVFLGVRPCEVAALRVLDRVLADGACIDGAYAAARSAALVVAVECGEPAGTCFCASMGTGPGVGEGFDLALTEIADDGAHRFLLRAGSPAGERIASRLPVREAGAADRSRAEEIVAAASSRMGRRIENVDGLPSILEAAVESPHWERVGARCLACCNCTSVCPTCFCHDVVDRTALDGRSTERIRTWDSCFRPGHSYVHGGRVRATTASRYRQWLTHKLGTWVEQYGEPGCVGCGRCITWCPVGIDLTEEAGAMAERAAALTASEDRR